MSFKKPFKIDEIDVENIKFTDVKTNPSKTIVFIKYDDNNELNNLVFQTPSLFNINKTIFRNNTYELDIPLYGKDDSKTNEFIKFLNKLDDKIIKESSRNQNWFNNFIKDDKIKYQKTIRDSVDKKYKNGTIKVKLLKSNKFHSKVTFDDSAINFDNIPENSWIKIILEVYAIWINENGFGLFLRPILLSFKRNEELNYNYNLLEDDSDEIDDIIHTVNDNSIFVRANGNNQELGNTTSILDIPSQSQSQNNENYFEELGEGSTINNSNSTTATNTNMLLSSTSSN